MKTLLRNIRSGEYLQSFETWTTTAATALDFESISRALDLVRRRGLKDMELVLADEPAHMTAVPVAKLHLNEFAVEESVEEESRENILNLDVETAAPVRRPRSPQKKKKTKAPRKPRTRLTAKAGSARLKQRGSRSEARAAA